MAGKSIDLLKPEEISLAEKKRVLFLKMGTIFLVIFYCLIVVSIFSFGLVIQRESKIIADKIELEKTRLSELEQTEMLQFLLKQRLSSLATIVETERREPKYWFSYLESLVPGGLALEEIQWNSEGKMDLSGTASDALVLSNFLDNLKQATDNQKIASSTLVSATRQIEGVYSFSLEIQTEE